MLCQLFLLQSSLTLLKQRRDCAGVVICNLQETISPVIGLATLYLKTWVELSLKHVWYPSTLQATLAYQYDHTYAHACAQAHCDTLHINSKVAFRIVSPLLQFQSLCV